MRIGKQPRDLSFKGAGIHYLAKGSVGREGQQIARDVKGSGLQRALERVLLHLGRPRGPGFQVGKHGRGGRVVFSEEWLDGGGKVRLSGREGGKVGEIPTAFTKILIAG